MSYGLVVPRRAAFAPGSPHARSAALHRAIQVRRAHLRLAVAQSRWRAAGILRLQISKLQSRRFGLVRAQAARGKPWAVLALRGIQAARARPAYRRVDLPKTRYAPWYATWPQTPYTNYQRFYPTPSYGPARAGYHPYVRGQVGAQVPSHMSRFGIGDMYADDEEGVVESIDLDGFGDFDDDDFDGFGTFGVDADQIAKGSALVAIAAIAFGAASSRKKDRQTATAVGISAGLVTLFAGKRAVDKTISGWGH